MTSPFFNAADPAVLRAYQDIRYGRRARRALVFAVLWLVIGLSLPYALDYIPPENYRVFLALSKVMRYLPNICYGLASWYALRSFVGFFFARSWCVTRWLGRKFGRP